MAPLKSSVCSRYYRQNQCQACSKIYGPFQALERIGSVAYRLRLPDKARIHDVLHVVFLKKHQGVPPTDIVPLPHIVGRAVPTLEQVVRAKPNRGSWDVLVQ